MFPLAHFLRQELRDAPGRASYTLRLTLSCAVLITLFMTLQIPFLAVALIVVFYVSQPNVLMIKLVSVVFFVTVTVALGGVLLIIKWTYDYPLIRLAASVALFFCAIYLMRVLGKLGLAFFVVALAVIYAQTFPSMTSQSEILVRLLLWLWVAINTAILVTLLVNACFQQAFPGNQFKARLAGMLHEVARRLTAPGDEAPPTFGETAAQFNQLQSLFAQASRATPEIAAEPQAWRSRLAATLRCYQLAALLLIVFVQPWTDSLSGLLAMSLPVLALAAWIAAGSERIAYAGIQIGFTFALAFLSWFGPLTNLTELRDRVLGILLGVLVSSIVHLYLWPDSEAPQLKSRLAALYRRLADCLAAPKEAVPLAPLFVAFTDSEALLHRVRAEPLGTWAHPWPQAKGWPMRATLAQAEEIARLSEGYRLNAAPGDPTLARCAEQLRRYAERIEQEAAAPDGTLAADLRNPFGPALATALAALPDWGPTPLATEQQAKTS
ncbi:FUSC family protein [Klebsiella variicola]|uniref:FUSC family protein n=1 Tax=Klebsiella variicola TaxID=244366 RepID=UPI00101D3CC0|nr:FUSC family protein [Klebsiella variicola]